MISIGNRIFETIERPSRCIVEMFRGLPSSNINDEMNRLFCMHEYIKPLNKVPLLGTAITVRAPIGDNLFFHKALDMAQPGDVIVVDGGSGSNRSLAGEIMIRFAAMKGLAGIVVDGCLRDIDGIEALPIAIYAKGITPQGPFKFGPGEINTPIACGGQVVFPGDILVGDADGVVVVPRKDAEDIAVAAIKKKESEDKTLSLIKRDIQEYAESHKNTTKSRFEGKSVAYHSESFAEKYAL